MDGSCLGGVKNLQVGGLAFWGNSQGCNCGGVFCKENQPVSLGGLDDGLFFGQTEQVRIMGDGIRVCFGNGDRADSVLDAREDCVSDVGSAL